MSFSESLQTASWLAKTAYSYAKDFVAAPEEETPDITKRLEPITACLALFILAFLPVGTKIKIENHKIVYYDPGIFQGFLRRKDRASKKDFEKYKVLDIAITWLQEVYQDKSQEAHLVLRFHKLLIPALQKLQLTYKVDLSPAFFQNYIDKIYAFEKKLLSKSMETEVRKAEIQTGDAPANLIDLSFSETPGLICELAIEDSCLAEKIKKITLSLFTFKSFERIVSQAEDISNKYLSHLSDEKIKNIYVKGTEEGPKIDDYEIKIIGSIIDKHIQDFKTEYYRTI